MDSIFPSNNFTKEFLDFFMTCSNTFAKYENAPDLIPTNTATDKILHFIIQHQFLADIISEYISELLLEQVTDVQTIFTPSEFIQNVAGYIRSYYEHNLATEYNNSMPIITWKEFYAILWSTIATYFIMATDEAEGLFCPDNL